METTGACLLSEAVLAVASSYSPEGVTYPGEIASVEIGYVDGFFLGFANEQNIFFVEFGDVLSGMRVTADSMCLLQPNHELCTLSSDRFRENQLRKPASEIRIVAWRIHTGTIQGPLLQ